jgi:WD40 repeat protein
MRRVLAGIAPVLVLLPIGCSQQPAPPENATATTGNNPDPAKVQSELARKEAELTASRARIAELQRQIEERSRADDGSGLESTIPPTPEPSGLTFIARERIHEGPVSSIAFSPDGKSVVSTDTLGRVVVSDAGSLRLVRAVEAATGAGVQNCAYSVCFDPDGSHFAVGSDDRTVWVWRADDGKLVKRIRGHRDAVEQVFFLPDGRGGLSFDRQGNGLNWTLDGDRREMVPERRVRKAALSSNGELLAWSDGGKTLAGQFTQKTPTANLGSFADALAVNADGTLVAKGSSTYSVELWDPAYETKRWGGPPMPGRVHSLAFTPDGKRLVSFTATALSVWDVKTGDETHRFRVRAEDGGCRMALAADGRTVAVGNRQGMLTIVKLPE